MLFFTAEGYFFRIHVASAVPKIASNNRLTGTAEEYAAIFRIGEAQERSIDKLTSDEFANTNHNVAGGRATRRIITNARNKVGGRRKFYLRLLAASGVADRVSFVRPILMIPAIEIADDLIAS